VSSEPTPPSAASTADASWFDLEDAPGTRDLNTCIHCGLCLTACPTYRELKIEPDSPRGRIYLMRGLAEGRIAPSDELVTHLDNCLDCRACETVCPAGVPYSRMLEETRGQLQRRRPRSGFTARLGAWALTSLIPHRGRMNLAADLLRFGQSGPVAAFMRSGLAKRMLPAFALQGYAMTPAIAPRHERSLERLADALPAGARMTRETDGSLTFHPAGTPKRSVSFFVSCVMDVMFPHVTRESIRLLVIAGAQVSVPRAQGCCGALHAHAGLRRVSKDLARHNVEAFARGDVPLATGSAVAPPARDDAVVTHSAGCGAALRDAGHLLSDAPGATEAAAFSSRVRDISEVLAELGMPVATATLQSPRDAGKPLRVAYHDPCHLAHAQKVRTPPRALLKALPGVELVDLPNSDWCCGSAGVYNLTHAEMANAQLEQKLESIRAVTPDVVVASNPGCLLHMERGAKQRGLDVPMMHLAEVMGLAYPAAGAASESATRRSRGLSAPERNTRAHA
jgi:glycolate oxidase iron-sulfur subunit